MIDADPSTKRTTPFMVVPATVAVSDCSRAVLPFNVTDDDGPSVSVPPETFPDVLRTKFPIVTEPEAVSFVCCTLTVIGPVSGGGDKITEQSRVSPVQAVGA